MDRLVGLAGSDSWARVAVVSGTAGVSPCSLCLTEGSLGPISAGWYLARWPQAGPCSSGHFP